MVLTVNGRPREEPGPLVLAQLIERLGLSAAACAAEVNRALVPKREHASYELKDGDVVELVTLVGGG
ncbi:MAG: sulfur carrier protein ThiS [Phycisphaeraceae bacterium]|nr:sulfur carrier protein ThiS [Phycisphaeraceae bacterium]MCW5753715.1 sulfur carrier protein ThiS [Phycisphaeraceae bacterium]